MEELKILFISPLSSTMTRFRKFMSIYVVKTVYLLIPSLRD